MGIVAYYVHVDATQLQKLIEKPAIVWEIGKDPWFKTAARIDIEKDWQVISWLASPVKRKEQQQYAATMNVMNSNNAPERKNDKVAFEKALAAEQKKLGIDNEDTRNLPPDNLLIAIEGRGTEAQRQPKLNYGLGGARVFKPEEVKVLSLTFAGFDIKDFRRNFDRQTMARFDVGGMDWLGEDDSVLDEFLVPGFQKISRFYQDAAKLKHYVLVIYQ